MILFLFFDAGIGVPILVHVNGGCLSRGGRNIGCVGPPVSIDVITGPSSRERENAQTLERHDSN